MKIPQHVAIILDGNGRWAKSKGMPRTYGHTMGAKEVNALMKLLNSYLKNCIKTADKNHMRVRVLGDISRLDDSMQKQIRDLEEASKNNDGLNFQIALNYGSRDEMIRAMRKMVSDYENRNFGYFGENFRTLFRYERYSGSGSFNSYQRGTAFIEFPVMATCIQ